MKRCVWVFPDGVLGRLAILCDACAHVAVVRCIEDGVSYREANYAGPLRCQNCKAGVLPDPRKVV